MEAVFVARLQIHAIHSGEGTPERLRAIQNEEIVWIDEPAPESPDAQPLNLGQPRTLRTLRPTGDQRLRRSTATPGTDIQAVVANLPSCQQGLVTTGRRSVNPIEMG